MNWVISQWHSCLWFCLEHIILNRTLEYFFWIFKFTYLIVKVVQIIFVRGLEMNTANFIFHLFFLQKETARLLLQSVEALFVNAKQVIEICQRFAFGYDVGRVSSGTDSNQYEKENWSYFSGTASKASIFPGADFCKKRNGRLEW